MTDVDESTIDASATFTPKPAGMDWSRLRGYWAVGLMLLCTALTGPIGYAGQLGYAALLGVAGIASLPMLGVKRAPMAGIGILLLLALWCLVTTSWSPAMPLHVDFHKYKQIEGLTALKLVLELALYGAFAFLMRELPARWAAPALATLAVSLTLISVLMAVDALSGQAIYRALRLSAHATGKAEMIESKAARGCYTVALLFWPVAIWMRRAGWNAPLAVLAIGFVIACVGLNVDAPLAAVVLGGAVYFAVRRFGREAIWALLILTLVYFALAPTIVELLGRFAPPMHNAAGVAKESWGARIAIWRFTADRIAEKPWLGWGMDASRVFDPIPLHPHSAALQIWLELGVVGVLLAALFWSWLWARLGAQVDLSSSSGAVGAATAVIYLTIGALSFGVWQEWWLALGVIAVTVCWAFSLAFRDWSDERVGEHELQELTPIV